MPISLERSVSEARIGKLDEVQMTREDTGFLSINNRQRLSAYPNSRTESGRCGSVLPSVIIISITVAMSVYSEHQ